MLLLEKDFAEIINGKNRSFKIRFGSKVRRYETDIRNLASKVQQLHGDSGVFLKRWQALLGLLIDCRLDHIPSTIAYDDTEGLLFDRSSHSASNARTPSKPTSHHTIHTSAEYSSEGERASRIWKAL